MSTRFRRGSFGVLIILSLIMTGVFQTGALAQDAPSQIGPVIPPASACTVEPRTAEELVALFANTTPTEPMPFATTETITIGKPADTASAEQVTALIYQAVACLNAGDFGRFFALLTDHAIVTIFPWVAEELATEEAAAQKLAPSPPPANFLTTILGIGSIALLPDGSFSAVLVQLDPNAGDQPTALILTAVEQDGAWLIDNAIDFAASE
ncbi:MAG TPA: hypothetical protein VFP05_15340 [Thermomicrobiales bacterium]|nr:hypothetical protein [Thermomicrobiales bacterium]